MAILIISLKDLRVENMIIRLTFFEYGKLGHIASNYFYKKNQYRKRVIKAKFTILDSNYNVKEDDCNFIAFMALNSVETPATQPQGP